MHTGGTSIPGSSTVTADDVIKTKPDVVSHINGGPTSIPLHEVDRIMDETPFAMEIVQCGNPKTAQYVLNRAAEKGQLGRVIFGNDAPSGTGIIPLGIMRNISFAASMTDIAPEVCVAMATGNPAKVYTKLNRGVIAPGKEADLWSWIPRWVPSARTPGMHSPLAIFRACPMSSLTARSTSRSPATLLLRRESPAEPCSHRSPTHLAINF